jgi:hypothetical protein
MIRTAYKAGKGGHILYGDTMFEIKSLRKRKKTNRTWVNMKPLYSYEQNRKAVISKKKNYIQRAAKIQGGLMDKNFKAHAQKRILR